MTVDDLSATTQEYLKVIRCSQDWSSAPLTVSSLAGKLGVSPSSASEVLRRLVSLGYVDHPRYGDISLTPAGDRLALAMIRRHRLLESFLVEVMGYEWHEVDAEADRLEHAVSDRFIQHVDDRLGAPALDPHGDPIPTADGVLTRRHSCPLDRAPAGKRLRIARVSDTDARLLQRLRAGGFGVGDRVEVTDRSEGLGTLTLEADGKELVLALAAARWILVDPI